MAHLTELTLHLQLLLTSSPVVLDLSCECDELLKMSNEGRRQGEDIWGLGGCSHIVGVYVSLVKAALIDMVYVWNKSNV